MKQIIIFYAFSYYGPKCWEGNLVWCEHKWCRGSSFAVMSLNVLFTKIECSEEHKENISFSCWSLCFELYVLNESQLDLRSFINLAMFTLFLAYCKEFQMYFLILLRPPARGRRKLRLKWAKNSFLQLREQHAENWEYLQGLKGKRWGLSNSKHVWAKNLIVLLIKTNFISNSPVLMLKLWKRQPTIN